MACGSRYMAAGVKRLGLEHLEARELLWAQPQMIDIQPYSMVNFEDHLVLTGADAQGSSGAWVTDGTLAGTSLLVESDHGGFGQTKEVNGTLFLANNDQIWKTDGTSAGTSLVQQLEEYPDFPYPTDLTSAGGYLFFTAGSYSRHVRSLWRTDGTDAGTVRLKTFSYRDNWPAQLTAVGDTLYFVAEDPAHGAELWKSDGTIAGTSLLKDIKPGPDSGLSSEHLRFTVAGEILYFRGSTTSGAGLWRSDGTSDGTVMLPGATSNALAAVGEILYFANSDGASGFDLWRTDGTEAGTWHVKRIQSASNQSWLQPVFDLNGVFYFGADDGTHGMELWRTDGTDAGTWMVQDSVPGEQGARPASWGRAVLDGCLFYQASDSLHGEELWMTDGTAAGTRRVADIRPGPEGSGTWHPTVAGNKLFWSADDGAHGAPRLWVMAPFEGDVNHDRQVDLSDFGQLKTAFGETGSTLSADLNNDGKVNLTDYGILKSHFGQKELVLTSGEMQQAARHEMIRAAAFAVEEDFTLGSKRNQRFWLRSS